ncbi:hypothetical protein BpHYR1_001248 [Brachionus plicatilis]|uniref:Uncharacterized protein n=1 Tax=Brachionus plicatilis TaxID=10195 RepID=A0A3M7S5F5_BRAPC|nr:hypothetical protein BpHYR1_001248 [Brachionus plicatilis]
MILFYCRINSPLFVLGPSERNPSYQPGCFKSHSLSKYLRNTSYEIQNTSSSDYDSESYIHHNHTHLHDRSKKVDALTKTKENSQSYYLKT